MNKQSLGSFAPRKKAGHSKLEWLRQYRLFESVIPRHDTIARVVCRLKSDEIEGAFQSWISSLINTTGADVIAIDSVNYTGHQIKVRTTSAFQFVKKHC
ncbi:transposase family protein [Shewanella psychrophila]|uniref:transposase family protein n=1 Tax=Shewanella psychrophila TaxID=225848 RepID=UPI003AADF9EF